jgi:hypothetical protein
MAMEVVQAVPTVWLPTVSILLAFALVVLSPYPDQEPALYLTAVAVGLFAAAISLWSQADAQLPLGDHRAGQRHLRRGLPRRGPQRGAQPQLVPRLGRRAVGECGVKGAQAAGEAPGGAPRPNYLGGP